MPTYAGLTVAKIAPRRVFGRSRTVVMGIARAGLTTTVSVATIDSSGEMKMRHTFAAVLMVAAWLLLSSPAFAQEQQANPIAQLPWQVGPTKGQIADRATIDVPEGYAFLGAEGTRKLEVLLENPPTEDDQYTLAPHDLEWIAFFTFRPIGYVKDDESLDAGALLQSVSEGTEQANAERRKRGWDTIKVVGWSFLPKYDQQLNALEWAILAETEKSKSQIVNYNTRLLGRRGVMEVTVVTEPAQLNASIQTFKGLIPGYTFVGGEKYAEFKPGDHVAEIGLAALITGGAAAVASKKGFFAAIGIALVKFWKLLVLGVIGIGMWLRRLVRGRGDQPST